MHNRDYLAQMMTQQLPPPEMPAPQTMTQQMQTVMPNISPQYQGGNPMQPIMDAAIKQRTMNPQQPPATFDPMNYDGQAGGIPLDMWLNM